MIDVLIVGGGPSGLTLALLLLEAGHSVRVLESRTRIGEHSRAIGIHPPGLAVLDRVGVGPDLVGRGVKISHGVGVSRGNTIAELDFRFLPVANPFVLSLPQDQTVRLLQERLWGLEAGAYLGGVRLERFSSRPGGLHAHATRMGGEPLDLDCRFLIGADGTRSVVRRSTSVPLVGAPLPDRYVMGDYPDSTHFGSVAALFLHCEGIVESFPLPAGLRRWVAWVGEDEASSLPDLVNRRSGHTVDPAENSMHSRFRTANRRVERMNHGNVVLIGDAAHEVSPIGGQGMTLGLLDAAELAPILHRALGGRSSRAVIEAELSRFSHRRLAAAKRASAQARLNMRLGRPFSASLVGIRDATARALFASDRFGRVVSRTFTMVNH